MESTALGLDSRDMLPPLSHSMFQRISDKLTLFYSKKKNIMVLGLRY